MKARNRLACESIENAFGVGTIKSANEYGNGDLELFVDARQVERVEQFLIWESEAALRADDFRVQPN